MEPAIVPRHRPDSRSVTLAGLLSAPEADGARRSDLIDAHRHVDAQALTIASAAAEQWLRQHGVAAGDRVAIWMHNRLEWLALLCAIARVGACAVSVNTRYRHAELEDLLSRTAARLLVTECPSTDPVFRDALDRCSPETLSSLRGIAVVSGQAQALDPMIAGKPVSRFDPFAGSRGIADGEAHPPADIDTPLILFTTSGTTRRPKLVVHSQRTLSAHARDVAPAHGLGAEGAVLLLGLPICGVYGLVGVLAALAGGARIVMLPVFDARRALECFERYGVSHVYGTDDMYRRLLDAAPQRADVFASARLCGYAAFQPGAMPFAREAHARGLPMTGLYGSSEVQALFALQAAGLPLEKRLEAGGVTACPHARVRVRDLETGALVPAGTRGELEIDSPTRFLGYLDDARASADCLSADGWFRTGDIGYLRPDGSFVFETRGGDVIRLGGFLVNPAEIEDVIKQMPGVADVGVVAVEIEARMRAVAFVVPTDPSLDTGEVQRLARDRMAGFKVPARVWTIDALPFTPSANGTKLQRARLREFALERLSAP